MPTRWSARATAGPAMPPPMISARLPVGFVICFLLWYTLSSSKHEQVKNCLSHFLIILIFETNRLYPKGSAMSSGSEERTALIESLSLAMRKVIVETVLLFDMLAERIGINATDMQCLNILDYEGPVPAGRLAELTGLTTGAITAAIDRLERAGYVQRVRDPHDRRRVVIEPMPQEEQEVFGTIDQIWKELCSRFSNQDLTAILSFMDTLYQMNRGTVAHMRKDDARPPT